MATNVYSPAARLALSVALLAGAGLFLPTSPQAFDAAPRNAVLSPATGQEIVRVAQADAEPEDRPVSFTSEQADRGEEDYKRDCVECHGDDLRGGLVGGPPLQGMAFEQKYANGAPASAMFMFMSNLMPPNAPGRYSAETYADLMAFILRENGLQPGGSELPSDPDALNHLIVEK